VRFLPRLSRRVATASVLLFTLIAWHVEAVAGQLSLTWLDNTPTELGFSVERSTGTTGSFSEIGTTGPNVTTHTDLTVTDAMTYCYRVRAFDSVASSEYSNAACATTPQTLPQTFALAVSKMGTGSGTVTSGPAGIACGATCAASYLSGTAVTLTAAPASGAIFTGWSGGGCTGTGTCTVTVSAATTVTATFARPSFALAVSKMSAVIQ
jgi:hypothetical protein